MKKILAQLENWRQSAPFVTDLGFFITYIAVTTLFLPGTAAAGAIFGRSPARWRNVLWNHF